MYFAHLFRPSSDPTLLIAIFRHLGKEETVEKVDFALSLFCCSFHQQRAIEVDDLVVEPLFWTQQLKLFQPDFFPITLGLESGVV